MTKYFKLLAYMLVAAFIITGCVKNDIDDPPTGGADPVMTGSKITIDSLKGYFKGVNAQIKNDVYVEAIVNADDRSGNIYKELIVQDATGGMAFLIDQSNYYTDYPVGRKVFIKLNGLWIGDNNGVLNVGGYIDTQGQLGRITLALVPTYVLKGSYFYPVPVDTIAITDANDSYINKLVCFKRVEFDQAGLGSTYADAVNQQDVNRYINDCNGNQIIMRNSGFADFAADTLPKLNGILTAVLQKYNADYQLKIRDTRDVKFTDLRCNGSGGNPVSAPIMDIRNLFTGSNTTIAGAFKIKGIVTSDRANNNLDSKNMVIEDATGAIVVRFAAAHSFDMGDEVEVDVSGQTLSEFHLWLQVNGVPLANAAKTGTGTVSPPTVTVQDIINNQSAWESRLVKVQNVTLSGSTTYSGSLAFTDGTNNTILFTRSLASFSAANIPTTPKTFTVIVSDYDALQLIIRNLNDVQ